jgi:hypothetical protein
MGMCAGRWKQGSKARVSGTFSSSEAFQADVNACDASVPLVERSDEDEMNASEAKFRD